MELNNIDLNKLQTFVQVHRTRSIRATAAILHLTPSAISMAISSLERSLGFKLFVRTGRRILPTANADQLASHLGKIFGQLSSTVAELRAAKGEVRGNIRLGLPSEYGTKVAIPRIGAFRKLYPDVSFTVQLGDQNSLIPALNDGLFDFIICDDEPLLKMRPQINAQVIATEQLVLTCSRVFFQRFLNPRPKFDDLIQNDHIAYVEHQADLQKWYKHHFNKRPTLKSALIANQPSAVLAAVQADLGLGLLPSFLVEDGVTAGSLKVIQTGKKALVNEMSLLRLKDHVPARAEQVFLKFLTHPTKRPPIQ